MGAGPSISVIVVAHNSLSDLRHSLPALIGQLGDEDELFVVDSGSVDGIERELGSFASKARLITAPGNVGFATGANIGVQAATGDLIVLLNPDAVVQTGWATAIREPWAGDWDAWMGLVTMDAGERINTSGGVLHFTGVAWAGQAGQPVADARRDSHSVGFVSGACLAIPSVTWHRLGGFSDSYFMYCEDVDLSLRIRLRGGSMGVVPAALVDHAYNFDKGDLKWRLLERNRWATIIRCFPTSLLGLLLPALVATEVVIWVVAVRGRWGTAKALATSDLLRALPRLLSERRQIQRGRVIDAYTFSAALTADLRSPYLDAMAAMPGEFALSAYWLLVRRVLRAFARA